jgi:hypothetical protein
MALTAALNALEEERKTILQSLNQINTAISALKGSAITTSNGSPNRSMSAAARARIAAAQKARWAKWHKSHRKAA